MSVGCHVGSFCHYLLAWWVLLFLICYHHCDVSSAFFMSRSRIYYHNHHHHEQQQQQMQRKQQRRHYQQQQQQQPLVLQRKQSVEKQNQRLSLVLLFDNRNHCIDNDNNDVYGSDNFDIMGVTTGDDDVRGIMNEVAGAMGVCIENSGELLSDAACCLPNWYSSKEGLTPESPAVFGGGGTALIAAGRSLRNYDFDACINDLLTAACSLEAVELGDTIELAALEFEKAYQLFETLVPNVDSATTSITETEAETEPDPDATVNEPVIMNNDSSKKQEQPQKQLILNQQHQQQQQLQRPTNNHVIHYLLRTANAFEETAIKFEMYGEALDAEVLESNKEHCERNAGQLLMRAGRELRNAVQILRRSSE